jgi:hypothetical protein
MKLSYLLVYRLFTSVFSKVHNSGFSRTESGKQDVAGGKGNAKSKDRMTHLMEVQEARLVSPSA